MGRRVGPDTNVLRPSDHLRSCRPFWKGITSDAAKIVMTVFVYTPNNILKIILIILYVFSNLYIIIL